MTMVRLVNFPKRFILPAVFFTQILTRLFTLSEAQNAMPTHPPVKDFGKLELNQESLRGSRWSMEYVGNIEVYHALEIVDIARVDVDTMSVRIEFHIRQRWLVDNLTLPSTLFKSTDRDDAFVITDQAVLSSVWSPDSYFPNARETKIASVSSQQSMVKIFRNKTITFSARISTVLGCAFAFQWYPVDTQSCDLIIESYTIPTPKVVYMWEDPVNTYPVTLGNIKLLQYELRTPLKPSNDTAARFGRSEKYAQVLLRFTFERTIGQYLIQVTIPTGLVVVLSWFGFWLGLDAVPGRISLVITCMLSLVTMHNSQKRDLPPVNYVKMSDIWMVGCMAFVFAAFCEFIIVKYIQWVSQSNEKKKNEVAPSKEPPSTYPLPQQQLINNRKHAQEPYVQFFEKNFNNMVSDDKKGYPQRRIVDHSAAAFYAEQYRTRNDNDLYREEDGYRRRKTVKNKKATPIWTTLDQISRFAFPFCFAIFCTVYWPMLFMGAASDAAVHI